MELKLAKKGRSAGSYYWGCSTFPNCTNTEKYQAPPFALDIIEGNVYEYIEFFKNGSDSEKELLKLDIRAQMPQILEHFIECTWGACYNTLYKEIIKPYLNDPNALDYVLKGDYIKTEKDNVYKGKTGAKMYDDLFDRLIRVESDDIKCYLTEEFDKKAT